MRVKLPVPLHKKAKKSGCDRKRPGRGKRSRTNRMLKAAAGAGIPAAQAQPAENHKSKKEALMKTLWKLICFILKLAAALAALSVLAQWLSCGYESHRSHYVVDRELTDEEE